MILERYHDRLLVIGQADHAAQAGLFARSWKDKRIPSFTSWEAVVAAAEHHDDGWIEWELNPSLDPETGQPWQFSHVTPLEHVPLYRRGVKMATERDPLTGLLVSMHAVGLYNQRYGTVHFPQRSFSDEEKSRISSFVAEQEELQQSLATAIIGKRPDRPVSTHPEIWRLYLLLQVWDRLSLQFAARLAATGDIAPLPDAPSDRLRCLGDGEMRLLLNPYPFEITPAIFPLKASLLEDRRYRDTADFVSVWEHARKDSLPCEVEALPPAEQKSK